MGHIKYSSYGVEVTPIWERILSLVLFIVIVTLIIKFAILVLKIGRGEKNPDILFFPFRKMMEWLISIVHRIL